MDATTKDIMALIDLFQKDKAAIDEIVATNPASFLARLLQLQHHWQHSGRPEELIQQTTLYAGNNQWFDFLIDRMNAAEGEQIISDHFAVNIPKEGAIQHQNISEPVKDEPVIVEEEAKGEMSDVETPEHDHSPDDVNEPSVDGNEPATRFPEKADEGPKTEEVIEAIEETNEQLRETEEEPTEEEHEKVINEPDEILSTDLEIEQPSPGHGEIISEDADEVIEKTQENIETDFVQQEENNQEEEQDGIDREEDIQPQPEEEIVEEHDSEQEEKRAEEHSIETGKERNIQESSPEEVDQDNDAETAETEEPLAFEPLHTVDYFASQGIKLNEADLANDKLGQQVKSFTGWLKSMKKLHPGKLPEQDEVIQQIIQNAAEVSNVESDVLTEAMAEVLVKQNKKDKAIEMYEKLSLMNPSKSAYFAAKILSLKTP